MQFSSIEHYYPHLCHFVSNILHGKIHTCTTVSLLICALLFYYFNMLLITLMNVMENMLSKATLTHEDIDIWFLTRIAKKFVWGSTLFKVHAHLCVHAQNHLHIHKQNDNLKRVITLPLVCIYTHKVPIVVHTNQQPYA